MKEDITTDGRAGKRRNITALTLAAILTVSLVAGIPLIMSSAAASTGTIIAGDGQGSILYRAHRVADPTWAPCFALTCDAGTGPGASMYFVVYNSSGAIIANGFADETGTIIKGLSVGSTYYVYPTDCNLCHNSTHNVVFDHWADDSSERPRGFTASSNTQQNADAYYKIVELGTMTPPPDTTNSTDDSSNYNPQLSTDDVQSLLKQIEATAKSKDLSVKVIQHNSRNAIVIITNDEKFSAPIHLHLLSQEHIKPEIIDKLIDKFEDKKNHPPFLNYNIPVEGMLDETSDRAGKGDNEKSAAANTENNHHSDNADKGGYDRQH
ncbi:MAG TPA: hypothetical protein VHK86_01425 [Nitrososphaera sp.]|jgi:hypothetical protein|nr:hypothetical protein [Nitrososphaera sp.]